MIILGVPNGPQGTLHQERLTQGFRQRNEHRGIESKFGKGNLGVLGLNFSLSVNTMIRGFKCFFFSFLILRTLCISTVFTSLLPSPAH